MEKGQHVCTGMTQHDLALQKLNEVRDVVGDDSDVAELVDTLATLLVLKQDATNPMFGAQVTFYEQPEGEWVDIDWEKFRDLLEAEVGESVPTDPEDAWELRTGDDGFGWHGNAPWWLRWRRDTDNHKDVPEGEIRHRTQRYHEWTGKQELDRERVPDEVLEQESVGLMQETANERDDLAEWTIYGVGDEKRFKVNRLVPATDLLERRAIVVEPHIAEQPSNTEFWDPNREEYTTPDDYPMGTVNLVVPDDKSDEFGQDYTYEMRVKTSVMPADGEPEPHEYTPGWE